LLLNLPASAAEDLYVTDTLKVTVRTGPSLENKILHVLESGDKVALLEKGEQGWGKVQLSDGTEGWMKYQYLQPEQTAALKLKTLNPENQEDLTTRLNELIQANQALTRKLEEAENKKAESEEKLEALKVESQGVLDLQQAHENLKQEFEAQTTKLDEMTTEVDSLKFSNNLQWFLAGAGVLILGWLIGLAMGKRKKRYSSNIY
jgi:SH3 domain protein